MARASSSTAPAEERRRGTDRSKRVFRMSGSPFTEASATSVAPSPICMLLIRPVKSDTTPATSTLTSVKSTCQSRSFGAKKAMSSVETVVLRIEASMRTSPMKSLYCAHESPASETNGKLTFECGVMIEAFSKPRQPCVM